MVHIAVRCKNWRDGASRFYNLRDKLKELHITPNRLIFDQWVIGTKKCLVYFYYMTGNHNWVDRKFDLAIGFEPKEQREILKEGCKVSRRFRDMNVDHTDEILKYFI